MKVWLNDGLVDEADARVSVFDHGLTVGDGVFETARVADGVPFALSRHLTRLGESARGMGLPAPDVDLVRQAVADTVAANSGRDGDLRLRITLTGGTSPLGSERGTATPTLVVAVAPMVAWAPSAKVVVVPWSRNERAATAGLKTTSYADNVIALAYARSHGGSEAIFGNTRGDLCEGTGSNVFLVRDGEVTTPSLRSGCLAGVTRALLLEWADVREVDVPLEAVSEADEVFLTSSTRDVQPVHAVGERELPPGPVTARLTELFAERAAADVDP